LPAFFEVFVFFLVGFSCRILGFALPFPFFSPFVLCECWCPTSFRGPVRFVLPTASLPPFQIPFPISVHFHKGRGFAFSSPDSGRSPNLRRCEGHLFGNVVSPWLILLLTPFLLELCGLQAHPWAFLVRKVVCVFPQVWDFLFLGRRGPLLFWKLPLARAQFFSVGSPAPPSFLDPFPSFLPFLSVAVDSGFFCFLQCEVSLKPPFPAPPASFRRPSFLSRLLGRWL